MVIDGTNLNFKDSSFDVIISFETIEHIKHYDKFLSELKRVLKPNGVLIMSTPNYIRELIKNKYHVSNMSFKKFRQVLSKYFDKLDYYFQGKFFYPFPARGILESVFHIKRDIKIRHDKPKFEHAVSIIIAKK